jgi:hypothetical protein
MKTARLYTAWTILARMHAIPQLMSHVEYAAYFRVNAPELGWGNTMNILEWVDKPISLRTGSRIKRIFLTFLLIVFSIATLFMIGAVIAIFLYCWPLIEGG